MRPTKYDGLLIIICLALSLLAGGVILLTQSVCVDHTLVAVVTIDDAEILRLPLNEDTSYILPTGHTLTVENGAVSVTEAPCPDQICVAYKPATHLGACIVCLPEKMVITIEEDSP